MASTRIYLLIPATLCFLLVLASAEQGKATITTFLTIDGTLRCQSNFSRIISNASVHLVINNATVPGGAGRTTSDGHLLLTVNLNSTEQLAALQVSNGSSSKAYVVAPPHACGAWNVPSGMQLAAAVHPTAVMTIRDRVQMIIAKITCAVICTPI